MVGCRTGSVEEMTVFRQIMHRSRNYPPRERWAQGPCKTLVGAEACGDLACKRCVKWHEVCLWLRENEYKRNRRINTSSTVATYNHCLGNGCVDLGCKRCVKWHEMVLSLKEYEFKRNKRGDTCSTVATAKHCLGELWRCKAIRKGHVWTLLDVRDNSLGAVEKTT